MTGVKEIMESIDFSKPIHEKNKTWLTNKLKQAHTHEREMMLMKLYEADPDLFWKAGLLGGAALATLGAALGLVGVVIGGAAGDSKGAVLGGGITLGGTVFFAGGFTVSTFSALMLAFPRLFGENGMQLEMSLDSGAFGGFASGDFKVG
ncbi:unnamed protein product [marine sediment metagenome]|uniref:Uncharacterized protein n=1 Tax=marine sediment metagenome TaxID=412755 RepID=X1SXM8_9ZZZZ